MATLNQLESLRIFRAVVESGNFSAAAQRLNCTPAWVSKTVEKLETELDNSLLQRSTRHMRLTEAGERCYHHALQILDDWQSLEDDLSQMRLVAKGKLSISVPVSWGLQIFRSLITDFMAKYPHIELNVQLSDEYVNVLEDRYDLVLRLANQLEDSTLLCQRLTSYGRILCAAPSYLKKHGVPTNTTELNQHACLVFCRGSDASIWQLMAGTRTHDFYPQPRLAANNSMLLREALLAGEGIALIPEFLVAEDIRRGYVESIMPAFQTKSLNLYSLRSLTRQPPYHLQLFHAFLRQRLMPADG